MLRSIGIGMLAFGVCLLAAPQAKAYIQENRFAPMSDKGGLNESNNDVNVRFTKVEASQLPAFMTAQLNAVLEECSAVPATVAQLDIYSYESDYTRREKVGDNYVVDFVSLFGKKGKTCARGPLCRENDCAIWGYYALPGGTWDNAFHLPAAQWTLDRVQDPAGGSGEHYAFHVSTVDPECAQRSSDASEVCDTYYAWRDRSIAPLMQ